MFEKADPVARAVSADRRKENRPANSARAFDRRSHAGGGDALRSMEWSELTARLNAARELRRELRDEAILCAGTSGARFGDAAAGFYKGLGLERVDGSERCVNRDGLERCKASGGTCPNPTGDAPEGDARDEK